MFPEGYAPGAYCNVLAVESLRRGFAEGDVDETYVRRPRRSTMDWHDP
jgi:hypothetical protein